MRRRSKINCDEYGATAVVTEATAVAATIRKG